MRVRVETLVPAPPAAVCAALLDPAIHARTASGRERVVGVVLASETCGEMLGGAAVPRTPPSSTVLPTARASLQGEPSSELGLGDEVTFEATHFGARQRLTARITLLEPPFAFEDTMVRGALRRLWHRHEFYEEAGGTRMVDVMEFASPLGDLFDRWVLAPYLERFLRRRGEALAKMLGAP